MGVWEIVLGAVLIVFSIIIILAIVFQEGHQSGMGVITGGADTFFSKNKARSIDSFLSRWTKILAVGFVIIVLALNIISFFASK